LGHLTENEKMEQQKKCIDLVADKFAQEEAGNLEARKWFDEYESATEGAKIAMRVITEKNGDCFNDYEDYFDWLNQSFLSFDFVDPFTFGKEQKAGYWRLQISWGGPSSEFRIYADNNLNICAVEYWYLDWYDGAYVDVGEHTESYSVCETFLEMQRY